MRAPMHASTAATMMATTTAKLGKPDLPLRFLLLPVYGLTAKNDSERLNRPREPINPCGRDYRPRRRNCEYLETLKLQYRAYADLTFLKQPRSAILANLPGGPI